MRFTSVSDVTRGQHKKLGCRREIARRCMLCRSIVMQKANYPVAALR